jgi:hypothetical protein
MSCCCNFLADLLDGDEGVVVVVVAVVGGVVLDRSVLRIVRRCHAGTKSLELEEVPLRRPDQHSEPLKRKYKVFIK